MDSGYTTVPVQLVTVGIHLEGWILAHVLLHDWPWNKENLLHFQNSIFLSARRTTGESTRLSGAAWH